MQTIAEYLPEHPFFEGLDPESLATLAGCASNAHLRPHEYLFHEGDPSEHFYVVRHGRVAIEVRTPTDGGFVLDTAYDGDIVGWSWLIPPHRARFDARATTETSVVVFDAACLRDKCAADPRLGYALLHRVAQVLDHRLHSARARLIDMYGTAT